MGPVGGSKYWLVRALWRNNCRLRLSHENSEGERIIVKQVVIENPVINSPFREPGRHFKFTDEGITNEIIEGRRTNSYFVPIAQPRKKKGFKQLVFDTEWTQDRIEENKLVNQIRARVKLWREGGYISVTPTTSRLLVCPRLRPLCRSPLCAHVFRCWLMDYWVDDIIGSVAPAALKGISAERSI